MSYKGKNKKAMNASSLSLDSPKKQSFLAGKMIDSLSGRTEADLCQRLSHNIFQLEKKVAYFNFVIQEIEDITSK